MLELRAVSHSVAGSPLLDGVSVVFLAGEICVVLGLSAEERRAVSRILRGQVRPSSGTVRILSRNPSGRRRIRVMALGAEGASVEGRTVRSFTERLVRRVAGAAPGDADLRNALQRAGLGGREDFGLKAPDAELRLRMTLAAALAAEPDVLVVSDPFEGIAHEGVDRLLDEMTSVLLETGAAVIYLASEGREASVLRGTSVVMEQGRLIQSGSAEDVAGFPVTLSVARAMAHPCLNTMRLEIAARGIRTEDGASFHPPEGLVLPAEGRITLAFRPADLKLERTSPRAMRVVVRSDGEEIIAGGQFLRFNSVHGVWRAAGAGGPVSTGLMKSVFIEPEKVMAFNSDGHAFVVASGPRSDG
jgi:ABC-type sugar transport system ATPase subunit